MQASELPDKGSDSVLQPLPQPPLRHSPAAPLRLQVAPEAQPAALLLVDVLTATHVTASSAPHWLTTRGQVMPGRCSRLFVPWFLRTG